MPPKNKFSFQTEIQNTLSKYPNAATCWIAYSGGLDSHVLLHALASIKDKIKPKLIAVHINHGLSDNARLWEQHCQKISKNYAIEFQVSSINIPHKNDQGTEAFAREKRYEVFFNFMQNYDLLLTAHHMNDQVETIFLQLMRGSGPNGLAGMPQAREFSKGFLVRPLLDYSREEIHDYALKNSLSWIEDESNKSNKYDRNFLRNIIIPELFIRWPGVLKTMRRVAGHQVDVQNLINEISKNDLEDVCECEYTKICIYKFNHLSHVRKKNVLRAWIKKNELKIPNAKIIEKIITEVIHANIDRNPCVNWQSVEVRRYRGYLYTIKSLPDSDLYMSKSWNLKDSLELTSGSLRTMQAKGNGIKRDILLNDIVEIRYRQGGEKIKPFGRAEMHRLKKLFQEQGIPPWLRDHIPLIFYENELIAVADLWIEHKYAASESEPAWQIIWEWAGD